MSGILSNIMDLINNIRLRDILDIAIIAIVVYKIFMLVKETRAEYLLKGIIFLLIATQLSGVFELTMINWILKNTMNFGVIAILIVFQSELRKGLEYIGRINILGGKLRINDINENKGIIEELVKTVNELSIAKTGGLLVFERQVGLNEIVKTGVEVDGKITSNLLLSIFKPNTPLHDGAVIISNGKIKAAGCFLPLTDNLTLDKTLGTRHRAGIGVTEVSDSLVIIVSEETGDISVAETGGILSEIDLSEIEEKLKKIYIQEI